MYWYMATTTRSSVLLTDETWAQIPRTHADRRAVSAALLGLVLLLAAVIIGSTTGILVPRLSYEGGSTTAVARTHSLAVRAIIHNDSARGWTISGATISAPGTVQEMQTTKMSIPAHATRTVVGVVHVDNCAAVSPVVRDQENVSYDIKLRIERFLGASTFTIDGVSDDMLAMACA
jgi:hypothetical protein